MAAKRKNSKEETVSPVRSSRKSGKASSANPLRVFIQRLSLFGIALAAMLILYSILGGETDLLHSTQTTASAPTSDASASTKKSDESQTWTSGKPLMDELGNALPFLKVSDGETGTADAASADSASGTSSDDGNSSDGTAADGTTAAAGSTETSSTPTADPASADPASPDSPNSASDSSTSAPASSAPFPTDSASPSASSPTDSSQAASTPPSDSTVSPSSPSEPSSSEPSSPSEPSSSEPPSSEPLISSGLGVSGSVPPVKLNANTTITGPDGTPRRGEVLIREEGQLPPLKSAGGPPVADFLELFNFDVTPDWIEARWTCITVVGPLTTRGYRVPLSTGPSPSDLVGSLTYYFNRHLELEKITFEGFTGELDRLLISLKYFHMSKRVTSDPNALLYVSETLAENHRSFLKTYYRLLPQDEKNPHKKYWVTMELYPPEP